VSLLKLLWRRRKRDAADDTPRIVEKGERVPVHEFDATLAGIDLENQDGSKRQEIVARAKVGDETIFVAQMGALKLVAVFLAETGEQLGYLKREVSKKVIQEARGYDYGSRICEISKPDPETGIRGVTLTVQVFEKP
jgi:hypothetical protein